MKQRSHQLKKESGISKRLSAILVLCFFLLLPAWGISQTTEDGKRPFIWEVQTDGGRAFILGSIHFLKKEFYPLDERIEKAFDQSSVLAVEADLSSEKEGEAAALTFKKGIYQGEDTLKDHLSEKTYELVSKKLKDNGMDIEGFQKFKPWMLALTIAGMKLMKKGFDPKLGIDKYFLEKAVKDKNKEIRELEGVKFQIELFDSFTEDEADKYLLYILQDASTSDDEVDQMIKAWMTGDADAMDKIVQEGAPESPELLKMYDKLIPERNLQMAKKIEGYLKTGKTHLVIAGAAHLVGKTGILELLKKKGYKVTQL